MDQDVNFRVDFTTFSENIERATDEFEQSVRENIFPVAELLEQKFTDVGQKIADQLAKAAKSGSLSMKKLGQTIAFEVAKIAVEQIIAKPLEGLLKSTFGGARAHGGFVAARQSYLVGERGPEIFTPHGNGHIIPSRDTRMNGTMINLNISGVSDIQGFRQSEVQIANTISRMLGKSNRVS